MTQTFFKDDSHPRGYAAHDVKYLGDQAFFNIYILPAKAEIPSRRPSRYGHDVENVLLPKPVPAKKKRLRKSLETLKKYTIYCHGCLGSEEGSLGVQRRPRIGE